MNKEQRREYNRRWIAKRRYDFFSKQTCFKCGTNINLELHHIDRFTKISHNIWSWREERRLNELKKCIILCNSCHKQETKKQFEIDHQHGTRARYDKGCRCTQCRNAHAERFRIIRAKWLQEYGPLYRSIKKVPKAV